MNNGAVDGGWNTWSEWTSCPVTCGSGLSKRSRQCNNPPPMGKGNYCIGIQNQTKSCETDTCQRKYALKQNNLVIGLVIKQF